jgi:translocation and assembly module TamB
LSPRRIKPKAAHVDTPAEKQFKRRLTLVELVVVGLVAVVVLIFAAGLGGRFAVLTPWGRDLVAAILNGQDVGRLGRLDVYGLKGDLWRDFTLDRATITDSKGVWLEAKNLHVRWGAAELFLRRFHAQDINLANVRLIRRPILKTDTKPPGPLPLSIRIDKLTAQLDLMEGFSKTYGHWIVAGDADVHRVGTRDLHVLATSVTRPGDFLKVGFSSGGPKGIDLDAQAFESGGGPVAGALGYSPKAAFVLNAQAHGAPAAGRFTAEVHSGDDIPLSSRGVWDKTGITAGGQIALSGSDLLRPLAERLGAQSRFGLSAKRQSEGRFAVAAVLITDNLTAKAQGMIDTPTQSAPDGVALDVQTPSVSRLAKTSVGGPGRFVGTIAGSADAWRLKGQVSLAQVSVAGYGLASASGPVDVLYGAGRWDAQVDARGAGGSGNGWLAGLLGARPSASARIERLADGRLLLDKFEARGMGLEVTGSGSRGLLGGLNFHGRAVLANAGVVQKGATGSIESPFDAAQAGASKPWRISLDARGRKLATGIGELDRLLGAEPRLQVDGALDRGQIAVDHALLSGKAGQATGRGLIGFDGDLKLALGWSAKGPFEVGPVELAGAAHGDGALTGKIAAPRADLKAHFDQIDVGQLQLLKTDVMLTFQRDARGFDGHIAVNGTSAYGLAHGASDFRFADDGVRLDDLSVDAGGAQAKGSLTLRRGAPSAADLAFAAGPGAFLASGHAQGRLQIADAAVEGLSAGAVIDLTGTELQPRDSDLVFHTIKLDGHGSLARLPFTLTTDVGGAEPVKFNGTGVYVRTAQAQIVSLEGGGKIRRAAFKTLAPFTVAFTGNGGRAVKADLSVGGGRMTVQADTAGTFLDAKADLTGVDLGALGEDFTGRVDAALTLTGRDGHLGGALNAKLAGVRPREGPKKLAIDGSLKAVLAGEHMRVDADVFDRGGSVKANASLDLPVVASSAPLHLAVARDRAMSGRYAVSGEVAPVWDLFLGGDRSLAGQVQSQGVLSGTINQPLIQGAASVRNGRFEDAASGLVLKAVTLDADFTREAAQVRQFAATDGKGGKVSGEGRVELNKGGASSFTLNLTSFQLIDNDIATAKASGGLKVTRDSQGQLKLAGALTVDRADIQPKLPTSAGVVSMDVVEINAPPGRIQFKPPHKGLGAVLDVSLKAKRGVFVKGRGLNVEFGVDAHVTGTTSQPQLTGQARVTRGDFDFSGQRFTFDDRGTVSLSTRPDEIRLDLRAVRDDPSLTAVVQVRGTAARPEVSLTSDPVLPQDEILSQVLFGTSAAQLSPIEAAQLASAVASLAGGRGFDVLGNLREFAGLDRLVFAGDATTGGVTVAGGKYVSDKLYLELIGGGKAGEAVQLEWRVRNHLSIISRVGGAGDAKLAVRWRKDLK